MSYPIELSKQQVDDHILNYEGHISDVFHDKDILYYILSNDQIIIYSKLLDCGYLYPDYRSFTNVYNPNVRMEDSLNMDHFTEMDQHISKYIAELERELNFNVDIQNDDINYLLELSECINNYGTKKTKKKLSNALFIFVGEKIRQRIDGKWTLKLEMTGYVSYHEPFILDNDGRTYYPGFIDKSLESSTVNLEFLINMAVRKYKLVE